MRELEAEKKLRGAKYHFRRMKETYLEHEEYFTYELEAFLTKLRSVPEVLLQDFNEKFSLNISLEKRLNSKIFEKRARELKIEQAIAFIQWWNDKMSKIRSDERGSILFKKRNISVHRKFVQPDLKKISVYETMSVNESVTVIKYDENRDLVEVWKSPEISPKPKEAKPPEMNWFFSEYPDENVLEVCEKVLKMVEEFIEEVKSKFN